jgi:hypothetical protein
VRKLSILSLAIFILANTSFASFEGTYETDRYGWCEMTSTLNPEGYYIIEWNLGTPGDVYFGAGIEAFGYLATAELDSDEVGIFSGGEGQIYGIWASIDRLEIHSESTEDAEELKLSDADISGTYSVTGEDDLGGNSFQFTMRTLPYEPVWSVIMDVADQPSRYGAGILVNDVLVAGFASEDARTVMLLKVDEGNLYGDWMRYRYTDDHEVKTGILEAVKVKTEE